MLLSDGLCCFNKLDDNGYGGFPDKSREQKSNYVKNPQAKVCGFFYFAVMITFTATILQFEKKGEKTGWSYINMPADIAEQLKPGCKKSFKVKGKLDSHSITQVSMLPMGDGNFIIPFNADMRKGTGKKKGAMIKVQLTEDKKEYEVNKDLMDCLADEPAALAFFKTKTRSFQNYYSKWIESAKTETTKAKRIAMAVSSLSKKIEFGEMLRMERGRKQ